MVNNETSLFVQSNTFLNLDEKLVITVILSILIIFGILTNALVVYAITSLGRCMEVPANLFVLNQSIAHLGNTVSALFCIFHLYHWNWKAAYCLLTFTLFSSLGSLCLLTLNRVISTTWPLKYPQKMTPLRAKVLVALIWLAASIFTLLHLIGFFVDSDGNFFNYGRYYLILLIVIIVSSNINMLFQSRMQAKKIKDTLHGVVTGLQRNAREDLKSVKTVAIVSATFLTGWLPLMVIFFLYGNEKQGVGFQRYAAFLLPLTILNIISDPLIYYLRSTEFRTFYQNWKRKRGMTKAIPHGITHKGFDMETKV